MKRSIQIFVWIVVAIAPTTVFAQWETKPSTLWTKADAEAVLDNSPWVAHQELRLKFDKERQVAAGSYSGVSASAAAQSQTEVTSQVPVDFIFFVRLRSALPMRQALSRLKQLQADTKMSAKERGTFDAQVKGLLECPACANNYIVTLSSKSTNSPGADAVYTAFKGAQVSDLQRFVYIANETGESRPLIHFVPPKVPGDEAIFFFSRLDDRGKPLLTNDNRELLIKFSNNQVGAIGNFKFDLAKLVMNGKIEF